MNTSKVIRFRVFFFFLILVSLSPAISQDGANYLRAGDSLYHLREYDSSITSYEKALKFDPANSTALYNASCVYSLLGNPDSVFAKLEALAAHGYDNLNWISSDTDLESVRGDKRWEGLITKIKQNLDKRRNPANMKFVSSDINNFWEMYDKYKATGSINDIEKYYFSRQSAGLKAMTGIRDVNPSAMEKALKRFPKYLESIRANTLKLNTAEEKLKKHFLKLKELYPDVIFPDIYFVMGCFNTGGTVLGRMLLIGSEMQCADKNTNKGELTTWLKGNIGNFKNIEFVVIHESIHTLQLTRASRLLDAVIIEGSCDFIASLVTEKKITTPHYIYGAENEQELWEELKKDKDELSYVNWLYQGDKSKERPADLGYYMGYRICESYYNNSTDKKQAIRDIIEIKDFEAFLKNSGYEKNFE